MASIKSVSHNFLTRRLYVYKTEWWPSGATDFLRIQKPRAGNLTCQCHQDGHNPAAGVLLLLIIIIIIITATIIVIIWWISNHPHHPHHHLSASSRWLQFSSQSLPHCHCHRQQQCVYHQHEFLSDNISGSGITVLTFDPWLLCLSWLWKSSSRAWWAIH